MAEEFKVGDRVRARGWTKDNLGVGTVVMVVPERLFADAKARKAEAYAAADAKFWTDANAWLDAELAAIAAPTDKKAED